MDYEWTGRNYRKNKKILEDSIDNNRELTSIDIEIIYLTVALYMKSDLTKSELLLKISELTNQVKGLSEDEIFEIKLFQKAFMDKFTSYDDKLKGEIEKMISITELDAIREMFPEGFKEVRREERIKIVQNMKEFGDNVLDISKKTGLSIEIEKL